MTFNTYIEEAKDNLQIDGWTDNWNEVINLAKEKYWNSEEFKQLKSDTLYFSNNTCRLCKKTTQLTAHHIFYGQADITICLCNSCHSLIHSNEFKKYGLFLQYVLYSLETTIDIIPPNLTDMCLNVACELMNKTGNSNLFDTWFENSSEATQFWSNYKNDKNT